MKTPDVENKIGARAGETTRVRMKARRTYVGPGGMVKPGEVAEIPKAAAERLVANGYADEVKEDAA